MRGVGRGLTANPSQCRDTPPQEARLRESSKGVKAGAQSGRGSFLPTPPGPPGTVDAILSTCGPAGGTTPTVRGRQKATVLTVTRKPQDEDAKLYPIICSEDPETLVPAVSRGWRF